MLEAIELSRQRMQAGEGGPFGALVVGPTGVIARGWNRVTSANDPTAHAEIEAIRAACRVLSTFQLSGYELFSSCEPCPMCLAAIHWARLDRVTFAATRADAAAAGFDDALLYDALARQGSGLKVARVALGGEPRERARQVFQAWTALPGKRAY